MCSTARCWGDARSGDDARLWRGQRSRRGGQPVFARRARELGRFPPASRVLHRRDRPSRGEHENPITGIVQDLVTIGEIAHIKISVDGIGDRHDPPVSSLARGAA